MGKVKQAYMAMTMDDMGEVPEEFRKEALLSQFSDAELQSELAKREERLLDELFQPLIEKIDNLTKRLEDDFKGLSK